MNAESSTSTPPPAEGDTSHYRHMVRGALWGIFMRWGVRLIGLVSVIILARLLTPADFGLVAMGSLAIGLLQGFTEMGAPMLLIRTREATREFCDTAWTVQLLQGLLLAVLLFAGAPLAADYFDEPRLVEVLRVLAVLPLLMGLQNIGMVLVRKELDFARDFRFVVYSRVLVFCVTLPAAYWLRSYWALVIGQVCGEVLALLLSYRMHAYRPRLCLVHLREFLKFAAAIVPMNLAKFLNGKLDVVVVGGMASTSLLGLYNVASELSVMVTREIVVPAGRGLFPNYAKLVQDPPKLADAYRHVLGTLALICLPVGAGLWATADVFVDVVLGDQWHEAIPLMQWLAIFGTLISLVSLMTGQILVVTGHERMSSALAWIQLTIFASAVYTGSRLNGIEGVAMGAAASSLILFPVAFAVLKRYVQVTWGDLLRALVRPVLASALMLAVLIPIQPDGWLTGLVLALKVALGALTYSLAALALWMLAGRPAGIETAAWNLVGRLLARLRPA